MAKAPKKKSGKGKSKAKKGEETALEPLEYFKFNPLAQLQELSLNFEENKYFTAFRPLLEAKTFPKLKSLKIQLPDARFAIQHQTESIADPAIELINILLGKASKKSADTKTTKNIKSTSKPEILIRGYDSVIRDHAQELSALGTLKNVAIKLSRTEEGEFTEMFSHLKDLKSLAFQCSPTADWQVKEVYQGISHIHGLTVLELYFKNYAFSQDAVKQIYKAVLKHSPTLKKLCLGFEDVENLNNSASIMDLVLQIPDLTILRVFLGPTIKKNLPPLQDVVQLKRLTELEIGAYFNQQKKEDIAREFVEICKNLQTLRRLSLRPVWKTEDAYEFFEGFSETRKMLNKKLKSLQINTKIHTWLLNKPPPKQSDLLLPKKKYYDDDDDDYLRYIRLGLL